MWCATSATHIILAGYLCLAETLSAHITSWQLGCRWKLASLIINFCLFPGNSVKICPTIRWKLDYIHAYCSVRLHVHKPCFHCRVQHSLTQFSSISNCSFCFPLWNFWYHLGHGCKPAEQWRDNTDWSQGTVKGNVQHRRSYTNKIKIAKLLSTANWQLIQSCCDQFVWRIRKTIR